MNEKNYLSLILSVANKNLKNKTDKNYCPPGINGPYNDNETPVRNTGHWLITYTWLFEKTRDIKFKKAADKLHNYLLSGEVRPYGFTFHHRNTWHKDRCNGLIGQAWSIESLAVYGNSFIEKKAIKLAKNVFLMHPFDNTKSLWKRMEIDGKVLPIDSTLNHQIWFAATAALLKDKEVDRGVLKFMDRLESHMTLLDSGVIYHPIVSIYEKQMKPTLLKRIVFCSKVDSKKVEKKMIHKSYGYHMFNMYALSVLYRAYPKHSFWKSSKFRHAKKVVLSLYHRKNAFMNKFGLPYNPIGFEVPLVVNTFFKNSKIAKKTEDNWFDKQLNYTYNPKDKIFDKNNGDPITLTARIYELTRT